MNANNHWPLSSVATQENQRETQSGATLGRPSYIWGFGQERRYQIMKQYLPATATTMLDVGCGLGVYVNRFRQDGFSAFGVDVEWPRVLRAKQAELPVGLSVAEALPFPDASFSVVLLHEVIEHVQDDVQSISEALRVTRPGGRVFIFAPNRLYPFETHGVYLGRRYIFGNIPLVNYLPDVARNRLCPHVRVYTIAGLRRLVAPLPCRIVRHVQIYPGYDKIARKWPKLAGLVRGLTYVLENTPVRAFGLSHFLVLERI